MAVESAINEARSLSCCAVVWRLSQLSLVLVEQVARRYFAFASSDGSQRGHTDQKIITVNELASRH